MESQTCPVVRLSVLSVLLALPALAVVWQDPFNVTPVTGSQYLAEGRQRAVACDTAGNVHVVWYDYRPDTVQVGYRHYDQASGAWLPETLLTASPVRVNNPAVASDRTGNVHVAWYTTIDPHAALWYKKYDAPAGIWLPETIIHAGDGTVYSYDPALACRPGGDNVHLVWHEHSPTGHRILHREYLSGAGWTEADTVGWGRDPSVAVDSADNVYVAWDGIVCRRRVGGTWLAPDSFPNGNDPSVAVTPSGDVVHLVWARPDGRYAIAHSRLSGGTWSAVRTISTEPEFDQERPVVACHPDGICDVVWYGHGEAAPLTRRVFHAMRYPSGEWSRPSAVVPEGNDVDEPGVISGPGRSLHLVWQDRVAGSADVWYLRGGHLDNDVGPGDILAPARGVLAHALVTPRLEVVNLGLLAQGDIQVFLAIDSAGTIVYSESRVVAGLEPGQIELLVFPGWQAGGASEYRFVAWTVLVGDEHAGNDTLARTLPCLTWEPGWQPVVSLSRGVSYGGWIFVTPDGRLFAGRSDDVYSLDPLDPEADSWDRHEELPSGSFGRGAALVSDGDRHAYATHGNNTLRFWLFDFRADTWSLLPEVPVATKRRKVKGGTDAEFVTVDDTGYVYLLKGYKTEFYRFNTVARRWDTLASAPVGVKEKWDKGSWIVHDGDRSIYAHKAKYYDKLMPEPAFRHEMWRYDIPGDSWHSTGLPGMPLWGLQHGRIKKKKSGKGGCAAWHEGSIYALKGGNTQQFWRYDVSANEWTEIDTVPSDRSTRKRRVNKGGSMVSWGNGVFFALKGNKTTEVWRYRVPEASGSGSRRPGSQGSAGVGQAGGTVAIRLVPAANDRTELRYSLPGPGPATVAVYDATGRAVLRREARLQRQGTLVLDTPRLASGVYLVQLEADAGTGTAKLVIRR
ncbi:T9SS type A sorting domain-containing protein [candidate division WOR-3 bacterium]|nr:T9SS type A sorting domain-containing protein [candidate division WOR-3 bacterium]